MDYNKSRATALRLISRFGNGLSATFTRTTRVSIDPLTGDEVISAPQTFTALVVVPPSTDRSRETARTQGYEVKFYVPSGFEPQIGDLVQLPGRADRLMVVPPLEAMAPDGEPIAYTVFAKRG